MAVEVPGRGSDWIDLAADQTTMFYTSEGRLVYRYDVSTSTQLTNFATLPGPRGPNIAFALRLLPPGDGSGGLLVADQSNIKRLDGSGAVVQTYDVAGEDGWFSLNLDPNGTSFWAGNFPSSNNFYRFNIATGAIEAGPINTGAGTQLFGLCLKGELTAAVGNIALTPATAQNEVGTSHTVTATITSAGDPLPDELVTFSVTAGPNSGATGTCTPATCISGANGQVMWMYTGSGGVGTDTIQACFDDDGTQKCATATKEWIDTNDPPSVSAGGDVSGSEGSAISLDGTVSDPDGDTVTTTWTYAPVSGVDAGATCSFADASAIDTTITCTDDGVYTATLTGNDGNNPPVSDSTQVTVSNVNPTVNITAPSDGAPFAVNTPVNMSSTLSDAGTNDTHTCSINWGDATTSPGVVTETNGTGTCTGSHPYTSTGFRTITVTVTDDDGGSGTDSVQVLIYAFAPGGGAFVIGNNSTTNTPVTFWGAQWWQLNQLSGGAAPASFKGFAKNPTTPSCGSSWSTDPGNSVPPPAGPLPAYMGVIVASSTSKSGSQISGNTMRIVVVQTNTGYANDPGHPGTGTVVATVCG